MKNYGCKSGLPHDLKVEKEFKDVICEVCKICNKKFRWHKGYRGRIDNKGYLEAHARNFVQRATNPRLFNKIYHPEKMIIKV